MHTCCTIDQAVSTTFSQDRTITVLSGIVSVCVVIICVMSECMCVPCVGRGGTVPARHQQGCVPASAEGRRRGWHVSGRDHGGVPVSRPQGVGGRSKTHLAVCESSSQQAAQQSCLTNMYMRSGVAHLGETCRLYFLHDLCSLFL